MPDNYYWSEGRRVPLVRREDLVAVRFREPERVRRGLASESLARRLREYPLVDERADARLAVLRVPRTRGLAPAVADLAADPAIEFVTPVFGHEGSPDPILVTDELVCQFKPGVSPAEQEELHRRYRARPVAPLEFAPNGYVVRIEPRAGTSPVEVANRYYESGLVVFAHPDFVKRRVSKSARAAPPPRPAASRRSPPSRLDREWHLENTGQTGGTPGEDARVVRAWAETRGAREVVVAVIDDGFDTGHPDFGPRGRIVSPLDVRSGAHDAGPRESTDNHGTCVLGVAGASGAASGLLGVAPAASLMPIRLDGGEVHEARAIAAAAAAGAWVVNCSWGPPDGAWWDPDDPLHRARHPLPDVVRAAMQFAIESGRGGRGAVLVWASGNGNETISNDGYASSPHVIAVGAVNHRGRRSVYSDYGPELALVAPSSDIDPAGKTVGGIWTTDRRGPLGYNPGEDWTDAFGGTSAAAPIVAGVAALLLAVNPLLGPAEVRAVLEETAAPVDPKSPSWGKRGPRRRSDFYGAGRVDAARAVARAAELRQPRRRH